jgi:hypothetical protein
MSNIILQPERIESALIWLSNEFSETDEFKIQNIQSLIERMNMLCNALPFINGQMALAKKHLNEAKVKAYHRLITSSQANEKYFSPSLAKDYVSALCSNEQYVYDNAERCSRSLVHLIDALRTCLSCLKEETRAMSYSSNLI